MAQEKDVLKAIAGALKELSTLLKNRSKLDYETGERLGLLAEQLEDYEQ